MLATRFTYIVLVLVVIFMNGWSLLDSWKILEVEPGFLQATLFLNVVIVPLCVWGAYRIGQMSEEEYRRKERLLLNKPEHEEKENDVEAPPKASFHIPS